MPSVSRRIVVVEDDLSMRQAIERILRVGNYATRMFESAEAALEADVTMTADCLVLDIMLPGMSGLELYQRLTSTGACFPTIFVSARDEPSVREAARRIGPRSQFVPKPFAGRTLLAAVLRALEGHSD